MSDSNKLLAESMGSLTEKGQGQHWIIFLLQRSIYSLIKNKYKHIYIGPKMRHIS